MKVEGEEDDPTIHVPVKSSGLLDRNWIQIAAGEHHAIALDDEGISIYFNFCVRLFKLCFKVLIPIHYVCWQVSFTL